MLLILVYDENTDNFFPLEAGKKPNPEENTHLIIDEGERTITLSFTPNSSLIEKRTIERRVASFIKTGYEVPGSQGLRIGAGLPLTKVDPKSGELPEILLSHGHTFGKGKLVRDSIPDYAEKEENYEVEAGSAGKKTDVLSGGKISTPQNVSTQPKSEPKSETNFVQKEVQKEVRPKTDVTKSDNNKEGLTISSMDEHLFILGQFIDMYIAQGFKVLVYKNKDGKYEFSTLKEDNKYFIDGNQLYQA